MFSQRCKCGSIRRLNIIAGILLIALSSNSNYWRVIRPIFIRTVFYRNKNKFKVFTKKKNPSVPLTEVTGLRRELGNETTQPHSPFYILGKFSEIFLLSRPWLAQHRVPKNDEFSNVPHRSGLVAGKSPTTAADSPTGSPRVRVRVLCCSRARRTISLYFTYVGGKKHTHKCL